MGYKTIIIPPRFTVLGVSNRAFISTELSNYLMEIGAISLMPVQSTNHLSYKELSNLVYSFLDIADGVFLQGGNDVDPSLYGQENCHSLEVDPVRDRFEIELVREAIRREIPIFGICRGFQLINVAYQGTLHQHLSHDRWEKHFSTAGSEEQFTEQYLDLILDCYHDLVIEPDGILRNILKTNRLTISSYHHQGIDKLGKTLKVEARSPDGIIEAFSCKEDKIFGIQWHPESDPKAELSSNTYNGKIIKYWLDNWVKQRI